MTKLSRLQQSQLSPKPFCFSKTIIATISLRLEGKGLATNSRQVTLIHYRNHLCPSLTPSSTSILIYLMTSFCIDYYNSSFESPFLLTLPPKSPEPAPLVIWLLFLASYSILNSLQKLSITLFLQSSLNSSASTRPLTFQGLPPYLNMPPYVAYLWLHMQLCSHRMEQVNQSMKTLGRAVNEGKP